jgi:hypothetical protein
MRHKVGVLIFSAPLLAPVAMAQGLVVNPTSFSVQGTNNGSSITRTLTISRCLLGSCVITSPFTATANVPWISFSPASGTTPQTINVTFRPAGLPGGANFATITVTTTSPSGSVQIPVTLDVGFIDITPQTSPSPGCFTGAPVCFYYHVSQAPGSSTKTSEILKVSGPSNFNVAFTVLTGGAWLSVVRQGSNINVNVQPQGLAPGEIYRARITVTASGYLAVVLDVDFIVEGAADLRAAPAVSTTDLPRGVHPFLSVVLDVINNQGFGHQLDFTYQIVHPPGTPSGWLTAQPTGTRTIARVNLTADTRNLPTGLNAANVVFYNSRTLEATRIEVRVNVVATNLIADPSTLTLVFETGASGRVGVSTNGPALDFQASVDKPWVSVSPAGGSVSSTAVPLTVTLLATMPSGAQTATLTITAGGITATVLINASRGPGQQTQRRIVVPQIADGGDWKTTVVVISNDTLAAQFTLRFYRATGEPLALPVTGRGMTTEVAGTVPAGGFDVIETDGTAGALVDGWAEIATQNRLAGYAIFRSRSARQDSEGVVPIPSVAGRRLLIPFDNAGGFATSVAVANADAAACASGVARFNDENGQRILETPFALAARNRRAFELAREYTATANRRGVAEFSCANVDLYLVGFRFNPDGAFTSIDPVDPSSDSGAGRRIVPQIADGDGWKTTMIVDNLDAVEAQVTISFFTRNGAPLNLPGIGSQVSRRIPAGGVTTMETGGVSAALEQGWAEIASAQKVAGTAVFRQRLPASFSEGAAPLPAAGGRRLLLYFDNTAAFDTAVAIANPENTQTVVSARFLDAAGAQFGGGPLTVAARGREAFQLKGMFTATAGRRGLIELISSSADVYVVVLRFNPRFSFTSLTPVAP